MALSLYDISVLTYLQILPAVTNCLEKGLAHCHQKGIEPETLVEKRVFPDMRPFRYQIHALAHHSLGAIEGLRRGLFVPPGENPAQTYGELQQLVATTRQNLEKFTPAEINDMEGKEIVFQVGDRKRAFTAEDFLTSFSLPNFYFHVTTAYGILRAEGVPIGKRDYLGAMRVKG